MIFDFKKIFCVVLSIIILTQNMSALFPKSHASPSTTDSTPTVTTGLYLRYEEEVKLTWQDWQISEDKMGEMVRKVSIIDVQDENFTVREDITYTFNGYDTRYAYDSGGLLCLDDYAYVNIRYMDGTTYEELAGGEIGTDISLPYVASMYTQYMVNKSDGVILKIWKEDQTDTLDKVPMTLELYMGIFNKTGDRYEYVWDAVGFSLKDENWGYSVTSNMKKDDKFDGWTVKDDKVDLMDQKCMNLSKTYKDEAGGEALADWKGVRWCDTDTGIKLKHRWVGDCKFQVYQDNSWSLEEGFTIYAEQTLAHSNFKLTVPSKVKILTPVQGQLVSGKIKITFEFEDISAESETSDKLKFNCAVKKSSQTWSKYTDIFIGTVEGIESLQVLSFEWNTPSNAKGKWNIKVLYADNEDYYDVVDVYFKPVVIGEIEVSGADMMTYGPHVSTCSDCSGALDRIPVEVSFDITVNEKPIDGNITILVDCWYLPLSGARYTKKYLGGTDTEVALFKSVYGEEVSDDPINGTVQNNAYELRGYKYGDDKFLDRNTYRKIPVKEGERISFENMLFFANPDFPKLRLYSFDVIIVYNVMIDGEERTMTDHAQRTIPTKHVEPIDPDQIRKEEEEQRKKRAEAAFLSMYANMLLGEEIAKKVYESTVSGGVEVGAKMLLVFGIATVIDTALLYAGTALFIYCLWTAPLFIGGVNAVLMLQEKDTIPTGFADIAFEVFKSQYGTKSADERIDIWANLLGGVMGGDTKNTEVPETELKLVNCSSLLSWAGIAETTGTGSLQEITLELNVRTYKEDDYYYMRWALKNPSNVYSARFLRVRVIGERPFEKLYPSILNERAGNSPYLTIGPGMTMMVTRTCLGKTENVDWKVKIYFPYLCYMSPYHPWAAYTFEDKITADFDKKYTFSLPAISSSVASLSPFNIHVYDQHGRHVGLNATGGVDMEIPGAWYSGPNTIPEIVVFSDPELEYRYEIVGTGEGQGQLWFYTPLNVTNSAGETLETLVRTCLTNITVSEGEIQSYAYNFNLIRSAANKLTSLGWTINEAVNYVISNMDTDGDGTPDVADDNPTEFFDLTHEIMWQTRAHNVHTLANSTLQNLTFNQPLKQISFTLAGPSGTIGFCNTTIPKSLLEGSPWIIFIDDIASTDFTTAENTTHASLYLTYTHSAHHVVIQGTWVIPEYPSALILLSLMIIVTLLATFLAKKRIRARF